MKNITDELWNWIESNMTGDPDRLRLSCDKDHDKLFAITQIDARRRVKAKHADILKRYPRFVFDSTLSAQQTTADAVARYHSTLIEPGARVLDMTGGQGIDAIFISDRAGEILLCEQNPSLAECDEHNFRQMGIDNIAVRCCDSVALLDQLGNDSFDCIFIDPARRGDHGQRLFALSQCAPDVTAIIDRMLQVAPKVFIKASPMLDVTHTISELPSVSAVSAVGTPTECKELLIECSRHAAGEPLLKAVTLSAGLISDYSFTRSAETAAEVNIGTPEASMLLYVPYPSVMKAGAFKLLCNDFGVSKLSPSTHLYFSETPVDGFPGEAYTINEVLEFNKHSVKEVRAKYPSINVTAKNFPLSADTLAAKLKVKSGGSHRLFACRNGQDKKLMIITGD